MSSFKYTPIDLEGRSFRLLQLCKGEGAFVKCYLFNALLHDAGAIISYEALSYTWGGTDKAYTVEVNGENLAVTKNLFQALRHLRYRGQDRILWIDAICIDQDNDRERGHQVGQMTSIYEQAERVVIWLGLATAMTDAVFDYIDRVKIEAEKDGRSNWRPSEEQVQPLQDQARRDLVLQQKMGLEDLLDRPWFKRVWIIQEVAKARSAQVLCGSRSVSGYRFAMIPSLIGIKPDPHCQAILDIMPGPIRKHSWWSQNRNLYTLLLKFKDSKASDPRDVIYALLGISSDGSGSEILTPNYEKHLVEVVQDATTFILHLSDETGPMPIMPRWTLPEFLLNLQSLNDAVFIWAAEEGHEDTVKLLLNTGKVDVSFTNENGQTPLLLAVKRGHEAIVKLLLMTDKININSKDEDNQTPLHLAAEYGNEVIVKLLLNREEIDVNMRGKESQTPLLFAAEYGGEAIVKLLINKDGVDIDLEDQFGWTALWISALRGHRGVVELLLNFEKDNEQTSICETIRTKNKRIAELLLETDNTSVDFETSQHRETPLWWAAHNGHNEMVELLLQMGKSNFASQSTPTLTLLSWALHNDRVGIIKLLLTLDPDSNTKGTSQAIIGWAIYNGHVEILELLLGRGKIDINKQDAGGKTMLWRAAQHGQKEIVRFLVNTSDVDIDFRDLDGQTPLWRAAWNGHTDVVKILADTGKANLNAKDTKFGQTPLSIAAEFGREAVVRFLLSTGKVDVESKDHNGQTPLSWATRKRHSAVVEVLSEEEEKNKRRK